MPHRRANPVTVAGQVDGDQRLAETQSDRVPRVGVLRAAVNEHQPWLTGSPLEKTHRATVGQHVFHPRDPRIGRHTECVLGDVLVKETELVVVNALAHGISLRLSSVQPSERVRPSWLQREPEP